MVLNDRKERHTERSRTISRRQVIQSSKGSCLGSRFFWAFVILSMSRIKRGWRTLSRLKFYCTRPHHRDKVLRAAQDDRSFNFLNRFMILVITTREMLRLRSAWCFSDYTSFFKIKFLPLHPHLRTALSPRKPIEALTHWPRSFLVVFSRLIVTR